MLIGKSNKYMERDCAVCCLLCSSPFVSFFVPRSWELWGAALKSVDIAENCIWIRLIFDEGSNYKWRLTSNNPNPIYIDVSSNAINWIHSFVSNGEHDQFCLILLLLNGFSFHCRFQHEINVLSLTVPHTNTEHILISNY